MNREAKATPDSSYLCQQSEYLKLIRIISILMHDFAFIKNLINILKINAIILYLGVYLSFNNLL